MEIFGFLKKDDLLLLPIEGRVFNRRRAFDRFTCVDAHLWLVLPGQFLSARPRVAVAVVSC